MQRDHLLFRMGVHWRTALQLRQIRKRVEDGDLGGELDGVLSDDERRWLAFWAFIMKRKGIYDESER